MILSLVTWGNDDTADTLTSEVNLSVEDALESILESVKIKSKSDIRIKIVEFFQTKGGHAE